MKRIVLSLLLVVGAQSVDAGSYSSSSSSRSSSSNLEYTYIQFGQKYNQTVYEEVVARNKTNPNHFSYTTSTAQFHARLVGYDKCPIVNILLEPATSPIKKALQGYDLGLVTGLSSKDINKDTKDIVDYLKARFPNATHVLLFDPFLFDTIESLSRRIYIAETSPRFIIHILQPDVHSKK